MNRTHQLRAVLALGASTAALLAGAPAFAQATGGAAASQPTQSVGEIVVTAQRKSESLQSVPVAVSAFSSDTLKTQRLDGGQNLELSVPNVNYSRSNFGGYNFQIRGIGTKVVSPTGDPGVSFNINELPVAANHLGDTDFYDVERVEVLRGPQGTLYGRNATGGAVNVIYAKPSDIFSSSITGEYGNFDSKKITGYINMPLGDAFSMRLAGFYLDRGGFGTNSYTGNKIDDRHLGSGRITLDFHPTDRFKASLTYEHFGENDHRNRVGKQLCTKDPGNATLAAYGGSFAAYDQGLLSQGCKAGSLYSAQAYGTVNSAATLGGILAGAPFAGLTNGDVYANHPLQNHNLHDIESSVDPQYKAEENLFIYKMAYDLTDNLNLSSLTGYNRNTGSSVEDYNRLVPLIAFNSTSTFPGGVVNDPQVGSSNYFRSYDYGQTKSVEISEEIRLQSSFKGPFNFSIGAQYINTDIKDDYVVMSNGLTAYAQYINKLYNATVIPIDSASTPASGYGHNYYDARYHVKLKSAAVFGEAYYQITPDLKLTAGLRGTEDDKDNVYYPIELLAAGAPGFGSDLTIQKKTFRALTGRVNLEWSPQLSFTNHTMIYGSYSRGYQGGGFNTPSSGGVEQTSPTFSPVYIDAFEVGTKNTFLGGAAMLNLTGFYYKEKGYQISQIVNKSSVNSNINANLYGVELESLWSPVHDLTLNANVGYLHTEITKGESTDQLNLTGGDPNLVVVKASDGSNCVADAAGIAALLTVQAQTSATLPGGGSNPYYNANISGNSKALLGICSGAYIGTKTNPSALAIALGQQAADGTILGVNAGAVNNLKGKQLPNSPDFTVSIGAQYVWHLEDWKVTLRGDYYWQDSSYSRVFNTTSDFLRSWDNANATLNIDRSAWGLNVQLYVKNIFNKQPLTDSYLTDASSGLFQNVFTLDPRTYGISITKKFD